MKKDILTVKCQKERKSK